MEGPILFWEYKEQESNLILPEHDDDDDVFAIQNVLYVSSQGAMGYVQLCLSIDVECH